MGIIRAIIFDWGRTLYDRENDQLFSGTVDVLQYCADRYNLAIVSLGIPGDIQERQEKVKAYDLEKYFKVIIFGVSDKNILFQQAIAQLSFKPEEILVVDDRTKRLAWPISKSCQTCWLQKGKFAEELPNVNTGYPTIIITDLKQLLDFV